MATKKLHPSGSQKLPNPWDYVRKKDGKLQGMLTDRLALSTLPKSGDVSHKKHKKDE